MYKKRLLICLVGGLVAGALCLAARQIIFRAPDVTWDAVAYTVANRILLGFAIALSGWRINRFSHGAIVGLLVSFSVSLGFLFSDPVRCAAYTAAGALYGLLIEWFASDVFKAPMKTA
jgi:hypothetical protein